jgi:hypothetical protein
MLRRDDQEGARFLSNPIRGGNNDIPAPTQHRTPNLLTVPGLKAGSSPGGSSHDWLFKNLFYPEVCLILGETKAVHSSI